MAGILERMVGAARLDVQTFEEVEADAAATPQAMIVVVLSAFSAGLGTLATLGWVGVLLTTVVALFGWFVWALLTYFIGARGLPEPQTRADIGQMLRTIGFASSPGVLRFLAALPLVGGLIQFGVNVWMLVAMVVAVRQALDYKSTGRAVVVCLIGFVFYIGIQVALVLVIVRAGWAGAAASV